MSDTMFDMKLVHADNITPDQLMVDDLIKIDNDIVQVVSIVSDATGDNYDIETENEFGEKEVVQFAYTDSVPLYVFIDYEEQLKVFLCASPHKNARGARIARPALVRLITFKKLIFFPQCARISI